MTRERRGADYPLHWGRDMREREKEKEKKGTTGLKQWRGSKPQLFLKCSVVFPPRG